MSQPLRRLIPQARTLITKESFCDQSFGNLDGYVQDLPRSVDVEPLVRVVQTAMRIFPHGDEASDGWLAPRVHAALRLFRSEAADQGIWDYLSVLVLRDYIIWRMADKDGLVNDIDRIIGPFRHQAVARLWWAAELSRNGADYGPTEAAFSSQDAVNYLTNVNAFHNRPAALAYIRFISHTSATTPIKQMAIETGQTLNHVLTTLVLDSFAPDSGSDMNAIERWIAAAPDATLLDSALPQGPDEPPVPEEKIYAVEQLLGRLMEEHRWHAVVDWTEQWIAAAQSPELAETAAPIVPGPGGNGPKEAIEKDVTAKDIVAKDIVPKEAVAKGVAAKEAVLYERFVEALRDDWGVEPSDQTRDLFEKISNKPESHPPDGLTLAHLAKELSKDKEIVDATPASGLTVPTVAVAISVRGDETPVLGEPSFMGHVGPGDARAATVETAGSVVEGLSKDKENVASRPVSGLAVSMDAVSVRGDETPVLGELPFKGHVGPGDARAAIVETAESVYEELPPEQQALARRIFLQLVELGEGTRGAMRRVTIEELILRLENALPVDAMLKMLGDARLITSDGAAVQIADEALICEWKRLREWLDQDRKDLRVHRHLAQVAQEWEVMQREPGALYRGARLAQALEWAKTNADEISAPVREFLGASKQVAEREGQSLAEAEARRAEKEHRAAMRWRQRALYLAVVMVIIALVAAASVYLALQP